MTEPKMKPAELLKLINDALGADSIQLGSDERFKTSVLPTGCLPIDYLLGGGVPRNRWTEFYGDFSTLKSYVALCCIAATQKAGGTAALIDTEHSFDPEWARSIGVDPDTLMVLHPETGEKAVDVTEILVRANTDLVVWDSIASTLPLEEQSKSELKDKHQPARLAALMSRATRKITACNSTTALLCVNQTRVSVGVVFGNPETTPGGKSLPFYASHRISMRKAGKVTESVKVSHGAEQKQSTKTIAYTIRATIEKSKLTRPFQDVYFRFDLAEGKVDDLQFLVDTGIDKGIITNPKGHSWEYKGIQCRGKAAIPEMMIKNGLQEALASEVLETRLGVTQADSKTAETRKQRSPKKED